ncbi:leucine-rich repeat-containing protein 46 isoform X1 [Agelaius tricolor]|uniref:leucine-rich repeat-containing protein 46 isoform X1 n=1 Tax=Agelaius tricolor TaxID=9191 RepID=UPI0039F18FA3
MAEQGDALCGAPEEPSPGVTLSDSLIVAHTRSTGPLPTGTVRLDRENISCIGKTRGQERIHSLYLQQNQIEKMENLECFPNLRFLCLAGNRIQRVQNLQGLSQLSLLDLSHNLIQVLDTGGSRDPSRGVLDPIPTLLPQFPRLWGCSAALGGGLGSRDFGSQLSPPVLSLFHPGRGAAPQPPDPGPGREPVHPAGGIQGWGAGSAAPAPAAGFPARAGKRGRGGGRRRLLQQRGGGGGGGAAPGAPGSLHGGQRCRGGARDTRQGPGPAVPRSLQLPSLRAGFLGDVRRELAGRARLRRALSLEEHRARLQELRERRALLLGPGQGGTARPRPQPCPQGHPGPPPPPLPASSGSSQPPGEALQMETRASGAENGQLSQIP